MPSKIRSDKQVTITVEMPATQAYALAQFIKRVGWDEVRKNAVDDDDANNMNSAFVCVRKALDKEGIAPR
jgi:hypothetical protein